MNKIFILGSGGLAKEILCLIQDINKENPIYEFVAFIEKTGNDESVKIGREFYDVIGEQYFLNKFSNKENISLAIGIGDPKIIDKVTKKFSGNFRFPNLIHPNFVGNLDDINFGKGNIITAGCIFTTTISVNSFNLFNLNTTVGHDTNIGSCNVINPGVNISGGVVIKDNNLIGTNATILQYKIIGTNSIIGASSLVTKDIPDNVVAYGNPCKVIKENHE